MDEGRLLSGEKNFEDFLMSSWQFLEDRKDTQRPLLVILGRPETISFVELSLELYGNGLTSRRCSVSYFDEAASRDLVLEYALMTSAEVVEQHRPAVDSLLDAYFNAVQRALGIEPGGLWEDSEGRRFAGYAPVLATLGRVIGESRNFSELESQVTSESGAGAWSVIESVCDQVFVREQFKLRGPLESKCSGDVPAEAYSRAEQVRAVLALVSGQNVETALRATFGNPADSNLYREDVAAYVREHPFVRDGGFSNEVLGSVLLGDAIAGGLDVPARAPFLKTLRRQPFLWRSVKHRVDSESLLDGAILGSLITSYLADDGVDTLRAVEIDGVVHVGTASEAHLLTVAPPLTIGDTVSNAEIECSAVTLEAANDRSTLRMNGPVSIKAGALTVDCREVTLSGPCWLQAESYDEQEFVRIESPGGQRAQVGLGGCLAEQYPWSSIDAGLDSSPFEEESITDPVRLFVRLMAERIPAGAPIVLTQKLEVADDERIAFATRAYGARFSTAIGAMIDTGMARAENIEAGGAAKLRIRFQHGWWDLDRMVASGDPAVKPLYDALRSLLT